MDKVYTCDIDLLEEVWAIFAMSLECHDILNGIDGFDVKNMGHGSRAGGLKGAVESASASVEIIRSRLLILSRNQGKEQSSCDG